jgi:hypothetical protein
VPEGARPVCCASHGVGPLGHHAELQGRGRPEDLFGASGILHPGQLHHDAAFPLLGDDRFGHAEFVDPLAQGADVLLQGKPAQLGEVVGVQSDLKTAVLAQTPLQETQFGAVLPAQPGQRLGPILLRGEGDGQMPGGAFDVLEGEPLLAQSPAELVGVALHRGPDHGVQVHLHQEVHPAAQVQPQGHRPAIDRAQPLRGGGRKVQRHHVIVVQGSAQDIGGPQLVVGTVVAQQQLPLAFLHLPGLETLGAENHVDDGGDGWIHLTGPRVRDLHRRIFGEDVRQRIKAARQDGDGDQGIDPDRIGITHGRSFLRCLSWCLSA